MPETKSVVLKLFAVLLLSIFCFGLLIGPNALASPDAEVADRQIRSWTPPKRIPEYTELLLAPVLVSDGNHTVHAFNIKSEDLDYSIMYRSWSEERGWSSPEDIILPEHRGEAPSLRGALMDDQGIMHLVYFGGDIDGGSIFYASAPARELTNANAWTAPTPIGPNAIEEGTAALATDGHGNLIVVFSSNYYGNGLHEVHSQDYGRTWSSPALLTRSQSPKVWPQSVELAWQDDWIHVVWHTGDTNGVALDIRYARLSDNFNEWELETLIAQLETEQELLGWPTILSSDDGLLMIYQDGFPPTRWFRRSLDHGETWSLPVRPFPHRGGYEKAIMVEDSSGTVHLILGNRTQDPEIHGMWYSRFEENVWQSLEPIISGPVTSRFDPCCPRAVISQGNLLLATWPHNVRREFLTGAWWSYIELDAPELPAVELPVPEINLSPEIGALESSPSASEVEQNKATEEAPVPISRRTPPRVNPANPIFLGSVPVLILLGGFILWRLVQHRVE